MNEVKGDACNPPGKGGGNSAHKQIGDCTHKAEQQPENSRNNSPQQGGIVLFENSGHKNQQRPCVKIHNPPDTEAVDYTLNENEHRYGGINPFAEIK